MRVNRNEWKEISLDSSEFKRARHRSILVESIETVHHLWLVHQHRHQQTMKQRSWEVHHLLYCSCDCDCNTTQHHNTRSSTYETISNPRQRTWSVTQLIKHGK